MKKSELRQLIREQIKKTLNEVSGNQISINIPKGIKLHMNKLGIPENNQSKLFEEYIDFLLGVNYGTEVDSFMTWTEEEDNITDFKDYD
jgi:hypothetical protein